MKRYATWHFAVCQACDQNPSIRGQEILREKQIAVCSKGSRQESTHQSVDARFSEPSVCRKLGLAGDGVETCCKNARFPEESLLMQPQFWQSWRTMNLLQSLPNISIFGTCSVGKEILGPVFWLWHQHRLWGGVKQRNRHACRCKYRCTRRHRTSRTKYSKRTDLDFNPPIQPTSNKVLLKSYKTNTQGQLDLRHALLCLLNSNLKGRVFIPGWISVHVRSIFSKVRFDLFLFDPALPCRTHHGLYRAHTGAWYIRVSTSCDPFVHRLSQWNSPAHFSAVLSVCLAFHGCCFPVNGQRFLPANTINLNWHEDSLMRRSSSRCSAQKLSEMLKVICAKRFISLISLFSFRKRIPLGDVKVLFCHSLLPLSSFQAPHGIQIWTSRKQEHSCPVVSIWKDLKLKLCACIRINLETFEAILPAQPLFQTSNNSYFSKLKIWMEHLLFELGCVFETSCRCVEAAYLPSCCLKSACHSDGCVFVCICMTIQHLANSMRFEASCFPFAVLMHVRISIWWSFFGQYQITIPLTTHLVVYANEQPGKARYIIYLHFAKWTSCFNFSPWFHTKWFLPAKLIPFANMQRGASFVLITVV